ncbi:MAG: GlsB/YeaQ/YmgE family stress response membrane protein [Salinibacterium sp.]|nr:MAG: GlsB/YeaQ/YmgE family stress response membrane protein [Salinibacterium sp.]
MGIIAWIVLGLIAGAIAKAVLPGRQGGGLFMTLLLGVVGAVVGGFLGSVLFHVGLQGFFNITTWLLAIGGAVVVLLLYSVFARGARRA